MQLAGQQIANTFRYILNSTDGKNITDGGNNIVIPSSASFAITSSYCSLFIGMTSSSWASSSISSSYVPTSSWSISSISSSYAPTFIKIYNSSPQSITTTGYAQSASHGLGVVPNLYSVSLVCVNSQGGYNVGDAIDMNPIISRFDVQVGAENGTFSIWADNINVGVSSYSSTPENNLAAKIGDVGLCVKGGNGIFVISPSDWNLQFNGIVFL
jgi:hypothetical protein